MNYLNKLILSKLLPSPQKYNFELEDVKRMNSNKGFRIPNRITNLNDFDRIAGLSGLNSSLFTNKDLKRLGIWSQIEESTIAIQTNRDLSKKLVDTGEIETTIPFKYMVDNEQLPIIIA